jgi:hypothetical protein
VSDGKRLQELELRVRALEVHRPAEAGGEKQPVTVPSNLRELERRLDHLIGKLAAGLNMPDLDDRHDRPTE